MMVTVLLALLGALSCVNGQDVNITAYKESTFRLMALPKVFGDISTEAAYNATLEFYKAGCVECVGRHSSTYAHPNACNMYMECVRFGSQVFIYGKTCGLGRIYDESLGICVDQYSDVCSRVGHPCDLEQMIPTDTTSCGPFQVCENDVYDTRYCTSGFGFNVLTGQCDIQCPPVQNQEVLNETCSAVADNRYYQSFKWVRITTNGVDVIQPQNTTIPCAASLRHLDPTKCGCDFYNVTNGCQNITSVHLSSSDNSWNLAFSNAPIDGSSSINGNGTITNSSSSEFPASAYFMGRRTFAAPGIIGNDLGLRFTFSFNFLYIPDPNNDQISSQSYALADNSICDIDPTYGCKLNLTSPVRGSVVCYVKPKNETELHVEEYVDDVDLSGRVSVYFAKDDDKGLLIVNDNTRPEQVVAFDFPAGVRASGNSCPLSIAAGTNKNYFSGYIDDMYLIKLCSPFL
ncbi:uncharacterized protein [Haliotis asinina]|uniref:uncharacterized protein n=1 Tax=Haliotis asinina TaxID=109174 RepID=UPI003531A186